MRLPDFTETFVAFFGFANPAHLRIKTLELLSLRIRWDFDRAFLGHERNLIVSIFVSRAVEHGSDPVANGHVVGSPARLEQNAIAIFRGAIRKRDEEQLPIALQQLVDLSFHGDAAFEFQLRLLTFLEIGFLPIADRRSEAVLVIIDSVTGQFLVLEGQRCLAGCSQINRLFLLVGENLREHAAHLQPG